MKPSSYRARATALAAGPQRQAILVFCAGAFVLYVLLQSFVDSSATSPQRSLKFLSDAIQSNGAGPPLLMTTLFKPAPSRDLPSGCAVEVAIESGSRLDLVAYMRLIAMRSCCTGRALLLVAEDELAALEGTMPFRECLGLPAAIWSLPPAWADVVDAVTAAEAEASTSSGAALIGDGALLVTILVNNPEVALPWAPDLLNAVVDSSRQVGPTVGSAAARLKAAGQRAAATTASSGESTSSDSPLAVEIFMIGATPYGYEKAAGVAAAALFEPLNWGGFDVALLSHPLAKASPSTSQTPQPASARGPAAPSSNGWIGKAPGKGRQLAPVKQSTEASASKLPAISPVAESAADSVSANATSLSDPSATLRFSASEGSLPVVPLWLDWLALGRAQWLGIHVGPGFIGEIVSTLAARPASLGPPRVVWTRAGGGSGGYASAGDGAGTGPSSVAGASSGAGAAGLGLAGAALRVDGDVLRPGGAAARTAWLLWAAPSNMVAAALVPPSPPWGSAPMQTLKYSTWRSVSAPDAYLLARGGDFFSRPGGVEAEVAHILSSVAAHACGGGVAPAGAGGVDVGGAAPAPAVVVDIGANAGYFTYLAALQGCTVLALEPQQACRSIIAATRAANPGSVAGRVRPYPFGVSSESLSFGAGWDSELCDGGYQVDHAVKEAEVGAAVFAAAQGAAAAAVAPEAVGSASRTAQRVDVPAELQRTFTRTGDDIIAAALSSLASTLPRGSVPTLAAVKIDVEGHEVHVLRSLQRTLRSAQLFHVIVEIAPTKWPLELKASEALRVLCDLLDTYTALVLPDVEYPAETAKWPTRTVFGRTYPRVPGKAAFRTLLRNRIDRGRGTNLYLALKIYEG